MHTPTIDAPLLFWISVKLLRFEMTATQKRLRPNFLSFHPQKKIREGWTKYLRLFFFVLGLELIVLTSRRCAVSEIRAPVKTNNNGKIQDLPTIDERLNNRNRTHFISGHVCGRE